MMLPADVYVSAVMQCAEITLTFLGNWLESWKKMNVIKATIPFTCFLTFY